MLNLLKDAELGAAGARYPGALHWGESVTCVSIAQVDTIVLRIFFSSLTLSSLLL